MDAAVKAAASVTNSIAARLVDGAVDSLFPGWGLRRSKARQELGYRKAMLAYAAAYRSHERQYAVGALTSEEAQLPGFSRFQLMLEGRDLYQNFAIIRAIVNGISRRAVSTGIHLQVTTDDEALNDETMSQWKDWCKSVDTRGLFDMDGLLRQAIRACYIDGDMGVIFADVDGDLKLIPVEGDLIAHDFRYGINIDRGESTTYEGRECFIIGGVILDKESGRPVAYLVGQRDMGGLLVKSKPISADDMILLFRQQRVDQVRGVPLLAPVIQAARDLDRYITATRMQANIAATFGVVIKREMSAPISLSLSQPAQDGQGDYRTQPLRTGLMTWLRPGEDIQSFQPDVPASQFDSFAKFLVRMIAIGCDTTYEQAFQDFSGMTFASSKTTLLDVNLTNHHWQKWLVRRLLNRVYCVWVSKRMKAGLLPRNDDLVTKFDWRPPPQIGADPQEMASANIELLKAGLTTMEDIYLEQYGANWKAKIRQRTKEIAFVRESAEAEGVEPEVISQTLPPGIIKAREREASHNNGGDAGDVPIQKGNGNEKEFDKFTRNGHGGTEEEK